MISHPDLPEPSQYTLRFSGERDASSIHMTFDEMVPRSKLAGVKEFTYADEPLFTWSPGSGNYMVESSLEDGNITTTITYNIGIQVQNVGAITHKGYQLFTLWEQQIPELVESIFSLVEAPEAEVIVPGSTLAKWSAILGDDTPRSIIRYLEEPVEGRVKTIDDVMRYVRDDWQMMLLVDPTTDALRLVVSHVAHYIVDSFDPPFNGFLQVSDDRAGGIISEDGRPLGQC